MRHWMRGMRAHLMFCSGALLAAMAWAAPAAAQGSKPPVQKGKSTAATETKAESPSEALAATLVAACRNSDDEFAQKLTADNSQVFREFLTARRKELMRRFLQVSDAGRPLLGNDAEGHTVVRCETPATTAVYRFGPVRVQENLAFIPVDAGEGRRVEFGMVREGGSWRVISLGLLLLNLHELGKQWDAQESPAAQPPQ